MTILDSPRLVGLVPPGRAVSANFTLQMAGVIAGTPKVDMLLGVKAKQSGRSVETLIASRHVLDVDEVATFYSTDFPTGGTEFRDFNGNETLENPTTDLADLDQGLPLRDADLRRPHRGRDEEHRPSRRPGASTPTTAASGWA